MQTEASCIDKVVGDILTGWRYDISGLAPEMRSDYELHLAECVHCNRKQRLHRRIDIALIGLAILAAGMFLAGFAAVRHFQPPHALWLQIGAGVGFVASLVIAVLVALTTPVPVVLSDAALAQARRLQERLPEEIRQHIPNHFKK